MSWLWLIPTAIVWSCIGFAGGRTIGEGNTAWEQEDHDKLALAIGFMIATNQLRSVESIYYFIYQVLTEEQHGSIGC